MKKIILLVVFLSITYCISAQNKINNLNNGITSTDVKIQISNDNQSKLQSLLTSNDGFKVILNKKTGSLVAGNNVRVLPVKITFGSIKINIKPNSMTSKVGKFSSRDAALFNNRDDKNGLADQNVSNVQDVLSVLSSLKVSPQDIISIFQAIKEAGAIKADLIVI